MEITLMVFELSLVGIYGAFGFLKTFRTQKAKEQMPWARDRSRAFHPFYWHIRIARRAGYSFGDASQAIFRGWLFLRQLGFR